MIRSSFAGMCRMVFLEQEMAAVTAAVASLLAALCTERATLAAAAAVEVAALVVVMTAVSGWFGAGRRAVAVADDVKANASSLSNFIGSACCCSSP